MPTQLGVLMSQPLAKVVATDVDTEVAHFQHLRISGAR